MNLVIPFGYHLNLPKQYLQHTIGLVGSLIINPTLLQRSKKAISSHCPFPYCQYVCRPSILSLDTDIYPLGVTCTHRSHMAPLGPFLGLVGVRASCGLVCGPLWCVCGSFWRVIVAIFLVVHITL